MVKVLLDTSVLLSNALGFRVTDPEREKKAMCLLNYLSTHVNNFELVYSERTKRELIKYLNENRAEDELKKYKMLPSYTLSQNYEETEEIWNNIDSKWGDEKELDLGVSLENTLPDKNKLNRNDRGIFGDAILNSCEVVIHENPKDFNKLRTLADEYGITLINLLIETYDSATLILNNTIKE